MDVEGKLERPLCPAGAFWKPLICRAIAANVPVAPDRLTECVLFKDFTPMGLGIIAAIAEERVFLASQPVFAEGSPSTSLFFVAEGRVKVVVKAEGGQTATLASLSRGAPLGEIALLGGGTHLCSVIAETDSKIVEIKNEEFQNLQKQKPQACLKLMMAIAALLGQKLQDNQDALKRLVKAPAAL
jgi:CRP/FNR family cyclic AMP-dependent transcriptional regulator